MAGQASEGSQFDACQYDSKMVPGFEKPSAIQQRGIVPFCKGLDVIHQAQSSTRKTLAFYSSIFKHLNYELFENQALVVAPTRELAQQIEQDIRTLGNYLDIKVHACFGGIRVPEDHKILVAGVHVGVGSPGRVFDMLCRQSLRANNIQMLVLDEADKMLSRDFKDQMAVDWSTLPLDLVSDIAIKLESCDDFIHLSAVCRSWNRASSSIKNLWMATPLPWLLLVGNTESNPKCLRNIFRLNNNKRYSLNLPEMYGARCWGSPYGWVAMVKRDLSVQLFNPITKANINFPSLQTIPSLPIYDPENFEDRWIDYDEWIMAVFLQKLIVLKVSQGDGHHGFFIMLLSNEMEGPAFAKHGDQSWTTIMIKESKVVVLDVVVMDDLVFALYNYKGGVAYWRVTEFNGSGVVKPMVCSTENNSIFFRLGIQAHSAYLVQSGVDLLLLIRHKSVDMSEDEELDYDFEAEKTIDFKIYRLNRQDKNWETFEDLGDIALFVGENSSMSIPNAHAKGLRGSCIYFTDDESEVWACPRERKMLAGHDMGVFNLRTNQIGQFYEGNDKRSTVGSPTWFVPHF